jgi:hypothetical protein
VTERERRPEHLRGKVERQLARRGTGSEHQAVVLVTENGERIILQRIGGNPFDDAETRRLEGHCVEIEGYRIGDIFRFTKVTELTF